MAPVPGLHMGKPSPGYVARERGHFMWKQSGNTNYAFLNSEWVYKSPGARTQFLVAMGDLAPGICQALVVKSKVRSL